MWNTAPLSPISAKVAVPIVGVTHSRLSPQIHSRDATTARLHATAITAGRWGGPERGGGTGCQGESGRAAGRPLTGGDTWCGRGIEGAWNCGAPEGGGANSWAMAPG